MVRAILHPVARMSAQIAPVDARRERFSVSLAANAAAVAESQRLRYRVFAEEMGAQIDDGGSGLDRDRYDAHCRHLLVRDTTTDAVVARTRLLDDRQAADAGGFYSSGEFELGMIHALPGRVLELGRTCVDAEYRNGATIAALWQGVAALITGEGYDYLFGCASIGLDDGGARAHAMLTTIRERHMASPRQRVRPYRPLPRADVDAEALAATSVRMPPLLKAYLSLGARACGEPYWDPDFQCADVFMLLDVRELNPRYARHFLKTDKPGNRRLAA